MKYQSMKLMAALLCSALAPLNIVFADGCKKDSVVLQHTHRTVVQAEINDLKNIVHLSHRSGRALIGELATHTITHGQDTSCQESESVCRKLTRAARQRNFSTFRRTHAFACSPNYKVSILTTTKAWKRPTNDRLIRYQQYSIDSLDLDHVWKTTQGARDVVVAVIDTGVDVTHPDLAPNILPGKNFAMGLSSEDPRADDPMDDNGHGTHVSGTIAALGSNNIGVAGIAWKAKILPLKFLNEDGSGYLADAIRAINYMVYAKKSLGMNIKISNNSWGDDHYSESLFQAIAMARDAGILFVAAAGNDSSDNDAYGSYPANYNLSNVISVGAYDKELMLSYFSNYGNHSVDIAAPGSRIASTYLGGGYAFLSGSSMAAPHVSGTLALLASKRRGLSAATLRARLFKTARYNPDLRGFIRSGAQLNAYNFLLNRTSENYASRSKVSIKRQRSS
jgi:subtilisin family serine protease